MSGTRRADAKWAVRRLATSGLFVLAIIGGSSWDSDPDSWFRITLRFTGTATFLMLAVYRTVTHWHEDRDIGEGDPT